jgi:hypothetical protein
MGMTSYIVTIIPEDSRKFSPEIIAGLKFRDRRSPWTLRLPVDAESKNQARSSAMRKARKWIGERAVRIRSVEEK